MNWLLHNPLADMRGVHFLFLYGAVLIVAYLLGWWWLWRSDPTRNLPGLRIPPEPDPFVVAYLADQEKGVLNVALTSLVLRGYIEVQSRSGSEIDIRKKEGHADALHLKGVEASIFEWCRNPGSKGARIGERMLAGDPACAALKDTVIRLNAVRSSREAKRVWLPVMGLRWLAYGIGPYKIAVALINGHLNVLYLLILCVWGRSILKMSPDTLNRTHLGRRVLSEMRSSFTSLLERLDGLLSERSALVPLLVAVYGSHILERASDSSLQMLGSARESKGAFSSPFVADGSDGGSGSCGGGGCGGCGGCGGGD